MRDISLCHPRLQRIASAWMKACATEGITVAISETLRTAAEQDALYRRGFGCVYSAGKYNLVQAKSVNRLFVGTEYCLIKSD